jgi:CBS domain-containing protein
MIKGQKVDVRPKLKYLIILERIIMHKLRVKDLMTANPVCIDIEENMLVASRLMIEKNFKHLLVTNGQGLVGILSDRDVHQAIKTTRSNHQTIEITLSDQMKVSEFMNWPVYTISENSSAKFALEQMIIQKVSSLVVENNHKMITGIITSDDFLGYLMVQMQKAEDYHV